MSCLPLCCLLFVNKTEIVIVYCSLFICIGLFLVLFIVYYYLAVIVLIFQKVFTVVTLFEICKRF
jgi:hypothetical protein